jgi:hypothetical protein
MKDSKTAKPERKAHSIAYSGTGLRATPSNR